MRNSDFIDSNLTTRLVSVEPKDVVYVKGVFEASQGVGMIFADHGGDLTVATPHSQARALDELLQDLQQELGATMSTTGVAAEPLGRRAAKGR